MTPANRHSQQTSLHRETCMHLCVLYSCDWLSCLSWLWHFWYVISLSSMKGVRPQRKQRPTLLSPRLVCAGSLWIFVCNVLAYLCSGMLGNWIPPLPVKLSLGLNRHCVIYCNLTINTVIPSCSGDWCDQQLFCVLSCHHTFQFEYNGVLFAWLWWDIIVHMKQNAVCYLLSHFYVFPLKMVREVILTSKVAKYY